MDLVDQLLLEICRLEFMILLDFLFPQLVTLQKLTKVYQGLLALLQAQIKL